MGQGASDRRQDSAQDEISGERAPRSTPVRLDVPQRPAWGRRLDRWLLRAAWLARRVAPRPSEVALEALARADRGPRPAPPPALPDLDRARAAFAAGRYGEALHLYGELLAVAPDNAWAWHGRGDALQLLGQPADALDAYGRACTLAPTTGLHHGGRANALTALGRAAEAEAAWAEALRLDPQLHWMRRGRERPG